MSTLVQEASATQIFSDWCEMQDIGQHVVNGNAWVACDGELAFDPAPPWIAAMFSIGRILAEQHDGDRPWLAVLSTPVLSSAAGMIALAAQAHSKAPVSTGTTYFDFLFALPTGTPMRQVAHRNTRGFTLSRRKFGGERDWLCISQGSTHRGIDTKTCTQWEPWDRTLLDRFRATQAKEPDSAAVALIQALIGRCDEETAWLRRQSSPLVFVGPTGGVPQALRVYKERTSFRLQGSDQRWSLADLLGLRGFPDTPDGRAWGGTYINPMSKSAHEKCERLAESTDIAIFDGIPPFRRFGDHFHKSSRLVVVSRAVQNDVLFGFCEKLVQLRQDSSLCRELPEDMPDLPHLLLFDSVRQPRT